MILGDELTELSQLKVGHGTERQAERDKRSRYVENVSKTPCSNEPADQAKSIDNVELSRRWRKSGPVNSYSIAGPESLALEDGVTGEIKHTDDRSLNSAEDSLRAVQRKHQDDGGFPRSDRPGLFGIADVAIDAF